MLFKSQAQRAFMYANHPGLAKEFSAATPKGAKLPEYVPGSKAAGKARPKSGLGKWI
jgi:hypothetical protein